jgi:Bacteriorhodopsin
MTDPVMVAHGAAAAAFLVGVGIVAALYASLGNSASRKQLAALAIIPGFAGISYVAMAFEVGTIAINGTEFVGFRYLDWVVTTPLLIGFVGYVAGASRRTIAAVMLADALMIAFGAAGVVAGGTTKWALFGVSSLFHVSLFAYLYVVFPRTVPDDPTRQGLFSLLKNHIGLLWLAYPFVWLMGPEGIGFAGAVGISLTYAFLDVLAKVPYVYFFYARRRTFTEVNSAASTGDSTPAAAD